MSKPASPPTGDTLKRPHQDLEGDDSDEPVPKKGRQAKRYLYQLKAQHDPDLLPDQYLLLTTDHPSTHYALVDAIGRDRRDYGFECDSTYRTVCAVAKINGYIYEPRNQDFDHELYDALHKHWATNTWIIIPLGDGDDDRDLNSLTTSLDGFAVIRYQLLVDSDS